MQTTLRVSLAFAILGAALAAYATPPTTAMTPTTKTLAFTRPASGSATLDIFGTINAPVGTTIMGLADPGIYILGPGRTVFASPYTTEINAALATSGSYTGKLFGYSFLSSDNLGTYTTVSSGVYAILNTGNPTSPVFTSPNVMAITLQAVPEPSAFAALGLGALGLLRHRRTRR